MYVLLSALLRRFTQAFESSSNHLAFQLFAYLRRFAFRYCREWLQTRDPVPLETREIHCHRRLESSQHIRIVELLPSQKSEATFCFKVHYANLQCLCVSYTAISYTWGDRTLNNDKLVDLDGRRAYIPLNLSSALTRFRDVKRTSQFIWADCLCIDGAENDVAKAEKSSQVGMMDRIFAQAEEVIIDLGELDTEDDDVLSTLDKYAKVPEKIWESANIVGGQSNLVESIQILDVLDLPWDNSSFWPSFRRFVCRPWFTRVWIIQEYALAKSPSFMIGYQSRDKDFLLDMVTRAAQHLEILYMHDRFYGSGLDTNGLVGDAMWYVLPKHIAIHRICSARNLVGYNRSLCALLDATAAHFSATDARDKVYAILGLSDDENIKQELFVDYSEPEEDLALRVSYYLSSRGYGIYPLYNCVGDREGYRSWAFNLSHPREGFSNMIEYYGSTKGKLFKACGPGHYVRLLSDLETGVLTVRGWILDIIDGAMAASMPYHSDLAGPESVGHHASWQGHALDWMLRVAPTQPLPAEEFTKACWRTVIADLVLARGQERQGNIRLRDWMDSARCIDTVDMVVRIAYQKWTGELPESYTRQLTATELNYLRTYGESFAHATGRKLALTKTRMAPCLVPRGARVGDEIVIVQGCEIPFVMRRDADGEYFRIVGCVYVHGAMDGEAVGDGSSMRDIKIR